MDEVLIAVRLLLAGVFVVAGVAKLADLRGRVYAIGADAVMGLARASSASA